MGELHAFQVPRNVRAGAAAGQAGVHWEADHAAGTGDVVVEERTKTWVCKAVNGYPR